MTPQGTPTARDADVVTARVRIAARPATVFSFLSDPGRFRRWMGEGSAVAAEPGGAIGVRYPNGDAARGEIVEIVPDRRLVFTWGYEGGTHGIAAGSTRVTIELEPIATGTLVTLRHEGLLDARRRAEHLVGWRYYLALLAGAAGAEALDARVAGAVDAWVAAWRETDPAARAALLATAVTDDVLFRDAMGQAEGRDALAEYIGAAHRFAPGMLLERAGPALRSHEVVLFPWRIVGADGKAVASGHNVGELAPEGVFRSMTGVWAG